MRVQAQQVFANLRILLDEAGLDWPDIVKTTTYLTNLADRTVFAEVRRELLEPGGYYPPNTLVVVTGLVNPDFLLEIEAIARRS
jgi:enamine deaminase RidA (YjgF/YER057c/UK114 family)